MTVNAGHVHADTGGVDTEERALDRARARRQLTWILAGLVVVVVTMSTAGWWVGLLERADAVSPIAICVAVGVGLFEARRRRGDGWTALRTLVALIILVLATVAVLFAGCVATQCVR